MSFEVQEQGQFNIIEVFYFDYVQLVLSTHTYSFSSVIGCYLLEIPSAMR